MYREARLHHSAYKISKNSLPVVLDLFILLGCRVTYRPQDNQTWAMVGQENLRYDIQLVEHSGKPLPVSDDKTGTHLAFISSDPKALIRKVEQWAVDKHIKFIKGSWTEAELYFDLPDLFVNFVIEIMDVSVESQ